MQVFCAVVEYESFSRAAEARYLTQSAISHLVKNLEKDLGTPLVYRHIRSVKPTPAGALFYQHAKRILSGYRRLTEDINELLNKVKGPLHIGADATTAAFLLPQLLYQFKMTCKEVIIHVWVKNPEEMVREIYNADIDFAITSEIFPEKFHFEETIAEDEMVLIGSENHSLAGKKQIFPEELKKQPFVLLGSDFDTSASVGSFFEFIGIDPKTLNIAMVTESHNLAIKMVKYGIGLSVVSKWSVFTDVRQGDVVILNASSQKILREFKIIRPDKIPVTAAARAFLQFTRDYSFFVPI